MLPGFVCDVVQWGVGAVCVLRQGLQIMTCGGLGDL